MKVLFPLLFISMLTTSLCAQKPCDEDSLMRIKGKWIHGGGPNANKAKSLEPIKRLDKMVQLLQAAYEPTGTEGKFWFNERRDESLIKNGPIPYDLTADFMEYYCNSYQNKINLKLGDETGDWFFIRANSFGRFAMEDMDFSIENKQVYQLTAKMGELNSFQLYTGADGNELQGKKQFSRTILIARPGQMPYTPVSRKQYLLTFLKYREDAYQKDIAYELKRPVRSDAEEEIFRKKGYENAGTYAGDEKAKALAKSYYLQDYVTDKQSQQKSLKSWESAYQKDIQPAKDFLASQSEEELAKPALLKPGNHKNDFKKFLNENEGRMLVVVNDSYFNSKLPAFMPQFLVVYWMWGGNKAGVYFGTQVEKNLNLTTLQQLLDK